MTSGGGFDAQARRAMETALSEGRAIVCPHCDVELSRQDVEPTREVAYVRRRVWVLCPQCRRTAGLDRRSH